MFLGMTFHQTLLLVLMSLWLVPFVVTMLRYYSLPYKNHLTIACVIWPFILFDEVLRGLDIGHILPHAIGLFQFSATLCMTFLLLCVQKTTVKESSLKLKKYYIPAVVVGLAQLPLMMAASESKVMLLLTPPSGSAFEYWLVYVFYLTLGFTLLLLTLKGEDLISDYHHHLSDQVVDVKLYKVSNLSIGLAINIFLAFVSIVLVIGVGLGWLSWPIWQSTINIIVAFGSLILLYMLCFKSYFSPSPLDYDKLHLENYSDEQLRSTLSRAEQAIIQQKAYKKIGLTLAQLAQMAKVNPQVLATAARRLLKRNFRSTMYYYRLEYAKKVLIGSDFTVTQVAKRLGFSSEKYLSDVFIRYIEQQRKSEELASLKEHNDKMHRTQNGHEATGNTKPQNQTLDE